MELLGLSYSPWTEKAKWALQARSVPFTYRQYQPVVGELALRSKLQRWRGVVSVPVLLREDGPAIGDSYAIARYADEIGEAPKLVPAQHAQRIEKLVALSERAMSAGRALALIRVLADREALIELAPRPLRKLRVLAAGLGRFGVRRTLAKYGGSEAARAEHEAALTEALDEVREAIVRAPGEGAGRPLLGVFTFADIAVAQAAAFISPPTTGLRLGAASRRAFTDPERATRYADVIAWRDALYARYRGAAPG